MRPICYGSLAMDYTRELVLMFYLLLVLAYTIFGFINGKGKKTQVRNTLVIFALLLFPPLVLLISLIKLYVYFFDPKANDNE